MKRGYVWFLKIYTAGQETAKLAKRLGGVPAQYGDKILRILNAAADRGTRFGMNEGQIRNTKAQLLMNSQVLAGELRSYDMPYAYMSPEVADAKTRIEPQNKLFASLVADWEEVGFGVSKPQQQQPVGISADVGTAQPKKDPPQYPEESAGQMSYPNFEQMQSELISENSKRRSAIEKRARLLRKLVK